MEKFQKQDYFRILVWLLLCSQSVNAKDYYVASTGSDYNNGTSISSAWASIAKVNETSFSPGDRIFFEGGKSFNGTLHFGSDDNGSTGNQVLISSFRGPGKIVSKGFPDGGSGRISRAVINGGKAHGIMLSGCSYITVRNIDFIGLGRKNGNIQGIGVFPNNACHIVIDSVETSGFQRAGLEMRGCTDLHITNVYAHDNGYAGISSGPDDTEVSKGIYIGRCRAISNPGDPTITDNHSGNGIVLCRVDGATVEYCEASDNGWDMQQLNENGPVGIWTALSNNVTIQYCISHNNKSTKSDGGGFDFDGGTSNCLLQYNYSYDNWGCGILLCSWDSEYPNLNNVVRYNISENDGQGTHNSGIYIYMGNVQCNTQVYNNVIYNEAGRNAICGKGSKTFYFRNNIFIVKGSGKFVSDSDSSVFQNNIYWCPDGTGNWNGSSSLSAWRVASGNEILNGKYVGYNIDPFLNNPGKGVKITDPSQLIRVIEYMAQPNSVCIDNGLDLKALFGIDAGNNDFFGNEMPFNKKYDIGVHEWKK